VEGQCSFKLFLINTVCNFSEYLIGGISNVWWTIKSHFLKKSNIVFVVFVKRYAVERWEQKGYKLPRALSYLKTDDRILNCSKEILKKQENFDTTDMTISVHDEPVWNLERRESSGHLFWSRKSSRVKFRCEVDVLEYIKDPDEHNYNPIAENKMNVTDKLINFILVGATCIAAIAVTTFLPWLIFSRY